MASKRPLSQRGKGPSPGKAEKMLEDNSAQGHPLTKKQKGFFGAIISRSRAHAKRAK